MAIPLQSMLQDILSQIRSSKGDMNPESFRAMTEAERAARGIDPRDPNQFSINDQGQTMNTLIGFNPNQDQNKNFADMISKLRDGSAQPVDNARSIADQLMRNGIRKPEERAVGAARGALRGMYKEEPNFSRPTLPENGFKDIMSKLGTPPKGGMGGRSGGKAIPKLERVSPGMYRNAKGNLVRK